MEQCDVSVTEKAYGLKRPYKLRAYSGFYWSYTVDYSGYSNKTQPGFEVEFLTEMSTYF